MLKRTTIDPTRGPLLSSIVLFSVPIMLTSLIQVLFNAADLAVLGNLASTSAVAAVGATAPICGLVVSSVVGLSSGTNIILSRALGAMDHERARTVVGTSVVLSLTVGLMVSLVGIVLAPTMLGWIACDPSYAADAELYLIIYFSGIPAILLYNFGAAILRVSGDSQRPLYYMLAAGALNILLNVLLCLLLEQKVAAVAVATLASQLLGAVLVTRQLMRTAGPCHLSLRHISFSVRESLIILRMGLPGAFNTALYSISNLQIQAAINSFGPASTAGGAAATQIEGIASSFTSALQVAALAFLGQNIGAGNRERVGKTFRLTMLMSFSVGLVLGVGLYLVGEPLLDLFVPDDELATLSIAFGMVRMKYILAIFFIAGINAVLNAAIQAFGYPSLPMINSIVTVLLFRLVWMNWVYPYLPMGPDPVANSVHLYACYPCSWTLSMTVNIVVTVVLFLRYRRGKVRAL